MSRLRTKSPGKMPHKMHEADTLFTQYHRSLMQRVFSGEYTLYLSSMVLAHSVWHGIGLFCLFHVRH